MKVQEAVAELFRLYPDMSTQAIADRVGCRREYVRVCRLRIGMERPQHKLTTWSQLEIDLLLRLRDEQKMEWEKIALRIGRSRSACHAKYTYVTYQVARLKDCEPKVKVAADQERARAARLNAGYRNLAAQFFGDPPIGFSALDRRLA